MSIKISEKLALRLESLGVGVVYLFGSEALGTTHFDSDIDVGVVLKNPKVLKNAGERLKIYNKVFSVVSDLSTKRQVDTVLLQSAPLSVQFEAIRTGKILYESSPTFRADYEENLIRYYLDFMPLLEIQHQAVLERIK